MDKHVYNNALAVWGKITREKAPEPIQQKIERFKKILDNFHVGECFYFVFNMVESKLDYCDPAIEHVLGYEPSAFSLEQWLVNIHPDDCANFLDF